MSQQSYEGRGKEYGLLSWRITGSGDTADDTVMVATTNLLASIIHNDNKVGRRGHWCLRSFLSFFSLLFFFFFPSFFLMLKLCHDRIQICWLKPKLDSLGCKRSDYWLGKLNFPTKVLKEDYKSVSLRNWTVTTDEFFMIIQQLMKHYLGEIHAKLSCGSLTLVHFE